MPLRQRFRRCSPGRRRGQAVLAKAAGRFAAAIKARDDFAVHVDHLAVRIDAQAGAGVMHDRRRPGGIERRLGDLVQRLGLAEIVVDAGIDKGIVARDGVRESSPAASARAGISSRSSRRDRPMLPALKKKPASISTCGGFGVHFSRADRVGIENRPDRTAAIVAVADPGERRIDEIVGIRILGSWH